MLAVGRKAGDSGRLEGAGGKGGGSATEGLVGDGTELSDLEKIGAGLPVD